MKAINELWADESGDSGFKFTAGSSRHLVITVVYGSTKTTTSAINKAVNNLKNQLALSSDYEFKFSRSSNTFKELFFASLNNIDWHYKTIVADKKKLHAPALINHPHQLYCELIRRLLYDNNPPLEKAVLTIDEAVAKVHHHEFNAVLKQYVSRKLIRKIKQTRSSSNSMIQLADMVSGSIFREYEKKVTSYHNMVKSKEGVLIEF